MPFEIQGIAKPSIAIKNKKMPNNNKDLQFLDKDSKKSFQNFIKDSKKGNITLFCGAGISVSAGLPTWYSFLKKIVSTFLVHWQFQEKGNQMYKDRVPKNMSIAMIGEFFENELPKGLSDQFLKEDSLILAQLIKNCIEPKNWTYLLRKSLYGEGNENLKKSTLVKSIVKMIIQNMNLIDSVVTYNYDDLIESSLNNKSFKTTSIVNENSYKKFKHFPVYHVHGILPIKGGITSKIYLSEDDFLSEIKQPTSWYNNLHASKLTNNTCLFVGLSFNDPNLKRLLATYRLNSNNFHYALLTHKNSEFDKKRFLLLKNELLRLNVRVIKYQYDSDHQNPHINLEKVISMLNIKLMKDE